MRFPPRAARFLTVVSALGLLLLAAPGAEAQQAGPAAEAPTTAGAAGAGGAAETSIPRPIIGVIDLQRVLREALAARSVRSQRETYVTRYQDEAARVEQDLRAADQELARLRSSLSADELAVKRREFQQAVASSQRDVQMRRRNLERAFGAAMSEVQQATIRIADEVASERGVNVILYRSQVFLFDNAMDLTDEILTVLNDRLPTVAFPDPEAMDDAPDPAPDAPGALPLTGD